jgi:hypothetical protein
MVKISIMRTLAPRVEGSPQNNAGKDDSLSLEGEGEHTAVGVIPFTLCSSLLKITGDPSTPRGHSFAYDIIIG